MKKVLSRTLVIVLSLTMTMTLLLAGCSQKGSKQPYINEEGQEVWELTIGNAWLQPGVQDDPIMKEITRRTGVSLKAVDTSEDRLKALEASNELPDIIISNPNTQQQYIEAGLIIPMDELLEKYGQNVTKNAEGALNFNKEYVSNGTGKVYYIPAGIDEYSSITATFHPWIRWDYYKEMGYPEINNYEDLYNVITEMARLHPTTDDGLPTYATSTFSDWYAGSLLEMPGGQLDRAVGGAGLYEYDLKANAFTCGITTPDSSWYRAAKLFNKVQRDGLLDPDTFTQTGEIYGNKEIAARYMVCFENWNALLANANFRAAGEGEKGFMPLPIPKGAAAYWGQAWPVGNSATQLCISSRCKYPEKAMELINFLYSEEGMRLVYNGVEGKDYAMLDGILQWTPETKQNQLEMGADFGQKTGIGKYSTMVAWGRYMMASDGQGVDLSVDTEAVKKASSNPEPWLLLDDFCEHYGVSRLGDTVDFREFGEKCTDETLLFRTASQSIVSVAPKEINDLQDVLTNYYMQEFPALIMSATTDEEFEAGYQKIVDGMKKIGLDTYTAYWDPAYAEAVKKSNELIGEK